MAWIARFAARGEVARGTRALDKAVPSLVPAYFRSILTPARRRAITRPAGPAGRGAGFHYPDTAQALSELPVSDEAKPRAITKA